MFLSREGDRREGILLRQGKGWFQVSAMGHEPLAALAYHLLPDDYLYLYYRDRPIALARGIPNRDLALAYFAREQSSSGGRMMPGHFSSRALNVFSVATPTGSQCLPATGTAWSFKLAGTSSVVLCTIGDAATRQGEFYEALAFALQERLPVVFVVEDNGYGISTPTESLTPYKLRVFAEEHLVLVNGRDPFAVFSAGAAAVQRARAGLGPSVLWCELDRLCSHTSSDDHRVYRTLDDIEAMNRRDPIEALAQRCIDEGLLDNPQWESMKAEISACVDEDYREAERAREPRTGTLGDHVYACASEACAPPISLGAECTMAAAVNATLKAALETDPRVHVFGEDVADPRGGVFGLTKGLSTAFPGRVVNAPLAEATLAGVGVGMAAAGWRPVFELQFIDFVCPALNQLMSQASCLRWRSCGEWSCPLTIIAPYGAYLPGGALWHSQSLEGLLAHIPGIRIAIPSTPEDAAGLLWTALRGEDPTFLLLPKHLFRLRIAVSPAPGALPFGQAAVRRSGEDVTLVSWGNCMETALEAATIAAEEGIECEVLDLRSIVPCDWAGIQRSLEKTGRLVVVHEDTRTTGFGQAIVAEMTSLPERWDLFLAPPQLVARADMPMPYHPALEYAALPDASRVLAAIRETME
ncbi:MAG: 2-oxoisovalerate dehydrogenase [Candidatus Hydrogenedentes bacterium]|nr:2-oxoisovalerate dehydrogenase [Candidatus Hydrogenedentota bacterium]